jgi:hypothetical protein
LGCLGPQEGGAPCMSRQHGHDHQNGHDPPLVAACASRVGAAVDRSFMQLPTCPFGALASRTNESCAMQACTMHGRRGGTCLVPQRRALWGGDRLSGLPLPAIMTEPTFPVDSAFGAGQMQLWSAGGLPSRLLGLAGAAPLFFLISGCYIRDINISRGPRSTGRGDERNEGN